MTMTPERLAALTELADNATADALLRQWLDKGYVGDADYERTRTCPGCGDPDLARTALTSLAYTFEVCQHAGDPHLAEQLWHRGCFAEKGGQR